MTPCLALLAVMLAAQPTPALPAESPGPASTQPASTSPTTQAVTPLDVLRTGKRIYFTKELKDLQSLPPRKMSEVVRFTLSDKLVGVTTTLPETDGEVRVPIINDAGVAKVNVHGRTGTDAAAPDIFLLYYYRFDRPNTIYTQTEISATSGQGRFSIAYSYETLTEEMSVQLIQNPTDDPDEFPVSVYIQGFDKTDQQTINLKLRAADFRDLRRRYPDETSKYVRPAFEDLGQLSPLFVTDIKTAWQILGVEPELTADAKDRLKTILGKLDSDNFADREAAQKQLQELGQPAALALRGVDPKTLSPQQAAEVDVFLAGYMTLDPEEAKRQGQSPDFLLDCLQMPEIVLRKAAWERLLPNLPPGLDFDPAGDETSRTKQVAAIRNRLFAPTTQP